MIGQLTNHLFQSTLFALAAALLVLAFRKNRARVRYSLWLAASLKFLIPFSMLIALGSQIHWPPAAHEIVTRAALPELPDVVQTVEQFSQPFTVAIPASPHQIDRRPFAIAALWFCGFACIMVLRLRAWRGMRIAIERSQPLDLSLPVEARLSSGVFEPGIVGLWRPMLLLPQGILERLTPSELEAVIAHELCHIRRRDNLFAAIQMLIEALFWFHPLVWWIGARLLEERERACDEYVVSQGNQPDIYADAILNVCKLYTESPLACVSGVTGADIRRRLETIMSNQKVTGLNFAKKIILTSAAIVAVVSPVLVGLLIGIGHTPHLLAQSQTDSVDRQNAPPPPTSSAPIQIAQTRAASPTPKFDVATIRPAPDCVQLRPGPLPKGRISIRCVTARNLVQVSYGTYGVVRNPRIQIVDAPSWYSTDKYDVEAEAEDSNATLEEMYGPMIRSLLADRFGLRTHTEDRDRPVYTLTVAKGGLKIKPTPEGTCNPSPDMSKNGTPPAPGESTPLRSCGSQANMGNPSRRIIDDWGANIETFLHGLVFMYLDRPVINKTGLTGLFDYHIEFSTLDQQPTCTGDCPAPADAMAPSIFTAFQEQLGLKLTAETGPVEVLVVDHLDRPSEN